MDNLIKAYINNLQINKNSRMGYYYDLISFNKFIKQRFHYKNTDLNLSKELLLIQNISQNDMFAYINYLKNNLNNSDKSIARKISSIKNFFKYIKQQYNYSSDIITFKFKYDNSTSNIKVLSKKQIKDLITYTNEFEKDRNKLIIFLMLFNGLTVKEIQSIKIDDIFNNNIIINQNKENERIIKINDAVRGILSRFINSNEQLYLINGYKNKMISARTIQSIVKNALKNIGIYEIGISTGILRNTAVKMLKDYNNANYIEIKNFLGLKSNYQINKYLEDKEKELVDIDMNINPFSKF